MSKLGLQVNRTLSSGKFAWQLTGSARVRVTPAADCKADLAEFCQPGALVQTEAMYYQLAGGTPPTKPKHPWTNCSVFGCTCKGEADYYGAASSTLFWVHFFTDFPALYHPTRVV